MLQAETIAQSAERGGKKVIQLEWAGGRNGVINGPTVDFRTFHSGRGVTTNFVSPSDRASLISSFGLQFDHPDGFAGQAPFPQATPKPATGWSGAPSSYSPALEIRMRVLDFGDDKYGLDAYIYDSTDDSRTNYDRVLFARNKKATESVANLRKGQLADVKVTVSGGALDGLTAGMLVKVEDLNNDASKVRLFHTSVTRAIATWPAWPGEAGFTGDFAEYVAQKFKTTHRRRLRRAGGRRGQRGNLRRAGAVLGEGPPATAEVSDQELPARIWPWLATRRPTKCSTSSSAWCRRPCRRAPPTPPTTTSPWTASRTAGSSSGRPLSDAPIRARTRPCESPRTCWART